jgi:hypothetical protein
MDRTLIIAFEIYDYPMQTQVDECRALAKITDRGRDLFYITPSRVDLPYRVSAIAKLHDDYTNLIVHGPALLRWSSIPVLEPILRAIHFGGFRLWLVDYPHLVEVEIKDIAGYMALFIDSERLLPLPHEAFDGRITIGNDPQAPCAGLVRYDPQIPVADQINLIQNAHPVSTIRTLTAHNALDVVRVLDELCESGVHDIVVDRMSRLSGTIDGTLRVLWEFWLNEVRLFVIDSGRPVLVTMTADEDRGLVAVYVDGVDWLAGMVPPAS